ncbi:MAG TPA: acyltransferase [Panacibacter sp.]|nr:acyltransferase [Panacibacter sp.]
MQTLSPLTSKKIKFWTFISMTLVVFIHGYNLNQRYLEPWTLPGEPLTITGFTEYFIANGISRFVIPLLFIISGYLLAMRDTQPYRQLIKKRLRTLGLPYLLWSAIGLAFVYVLELFPYTRSLVASSRMMAVSDTQLLLHDNTWYQLFGRWLLLPVPYQLWFLRVLIIYNLAYPALRWCVTHKTAKWIYFIIATLLWLGTVNLLLIEGEGLLFFALGIWMQKSSFNIEKPNRLLNPLLWCIVCFVVCVIKTLLAFNGEALIGSSVYTVLTLLHKLAMFSALVAVWYGGDWLMQFFMNRKWFVWLSGFSFIIYVSHAPAVALFIDAYFQLLHYTYAYRILTFILLPLSLIASCITLGLLLRSLTPKLYTLLTGGRGFT